MADQDGRNEDVTSSSTVIGAASAEMGDNITAEESPNRGDSSSGPIEESRAPPANERTTMPPPSLPPVSTSSTSSSRKPEAEESSDPTQFKVPTASTAPPKIGPSNKSTNSTVSTASQDEENEDKTRQTQSAGPSPAEKLKYSQIPIPYKEPMWGGRPQTEYALEVLKNGAIIDRIDITKKSFYVFGRLPSCDVTMEHPSLSRHHAVLQFCPLPTQTHKAGWHLYDLDSTHGTWINKHRVNPKVYYKLNVGHIMKFGGSSRLYILQGPDEDVEPESELSVTEMKEQKERQQREAEILRQADIAAEEAAREQEEREKEEQDEGCGWGMDEDAVDPEMENPFAVTETPENEDLYINDPKKALKNYFEREGLDLPEYEFAEESGWGQHRCRVELPTIDSPSGEPVYAQVNHSGKKKDAVVACALEACRMLDRHGLLRKAQQESRKKKAKDWEENDYYDSDEDTFLDRTGDVEKKRKMRMQRAGKLEQKTENYESLVKKRQEVQEQIKTIEEKLDKAKAESAKLDSDDIDALDAYMSAIKSGAMDTKTRMSLKRELFDLRKEEQRLLKLVNIAKPAGLSLQKNTDVKKTGTLLPKTAPMFGRIRGLKNVKPVSKVPAQQSSGQSATTSKHEKEEEEEEEEEEDEEEENKTKADEKLQEGTVAERLKDSDKVISENEPSLPQKTVHFPTISKEDNTHVDEEKASKEEHTNQEKFSSKTEKLKDQSELSFHKVSAQSSPAPQLTNRKRSSMPEMTAQKIKKVKETPLSKEYADSDPDYATWVPPQGQTGDGKTHLNEKYGY